MLLTSFLWDRLWSLSLPTLSLKLCVKFKFRWSVSPLRFVLSFSIKEHSLESSSSIVLCLVGTIIVASDYLPDVLSNPYDEFTVVPFLLFESLVSIPLSEFGPLDLFFFFYLNPFKSSNTNASPYFRSKVRRLVTPGNRLKSRTRHILSNFLISANF